MDNPFKKLLNNEELPDLLKQKVLDDVAAIKLTIDIADLFVVKYPNVIGDILLSSSSENKKNKK